jgi:iron complex transport system ATP-binding protein
MGVKAVMNSSAEQAPAEVVERELSRPLSGDSGSYCIGDGVILEQTPSHVHLAFQQPRRVLSSAVLNGGFSLVSHFVNMKVSTECPLDLEDPAITLRRYCRGKGWQGDAVGMMTAASMKSFRAAYDNVADESLAVVVTTGLGNARRAGDSAEGIELSTMPRKAGTINMAIVTSAALTDAAMVEMVSVIAEAKAAALQELGIKSPVSGRLATGTGTDAAAIFCGDIGTLHEPVRFTGKHTLIGERTAQMVIDTLHASINYLSAGPQAKVSS